MTVRKLIALLLNILKEHGDIPIYLAGHGTNFTLEERDIEVMKNFDGKNYHILIIETD